MSPEDIKSESQKEPTKAPVKKLSEADFSLTESVQPFITITPPVGTSREDILAPIFWSHVARRMKPMSEIRALPKDGAWYGIYLVLYADNISARVVELEFYQLEVLSEPEVDTDPYFVKWISPPVKWGVIRRVDKSVAKDGFATKSQAEAWKHQNFSSSKAA